MKRFLKNNSIYLFLLPFFFVFHGYTENFPFIEIPTLLSLVIRYLLYSLLLFLLFFFLYKSDIKAGLLAFSLMSFNFFFGKGYDFLLTYFNNTFIATYNFIIIFSLITLLGIAVFLYSTKNKLNSFVLYFNCLFILLILIDLGVLTSKFVNKGKSNINQLSTNLTICDTCKKPDIYLIILDEYAGARQLKEQFIFDNSNFENELKNRGFNIIQNSTSNYNLTPYSIASLMNMAYIENLKSNGINKFDEFESIRIIKNNNVVDFFKKSGYQIFNYSIFDLKRNVKQVKSSFIDAEEDLITFQTFTKKLQKIPLFKTLFQYQNNIYHNQTLIGNLKLEALTKQVVTTPGTSPKFVYTHLLMPHYFYYFDSVGKKNNYETLVENVKNKNYYLQYLVYTNKIILTLIDHIKEKSLQPPIILLMGDHGYRQVRGTSIEDNRYQHMTLNSIFIPGNNYTGFYHGMSHVNQFRVLLNYQFGLKLPLLKDSTSFIKH